MEISRRVTLEELPPVLVLHLKRFVYEKTGGCQKLVKNIEYFVDLEISKGKDLFLTDFPPLFRHICASLFFLVHKISFPVLPGNVIIWINALCAFLSLYCFSFFFFFFFVIFMKRIYLGFWV